MPVKEARSIFGDFCKEDLNTAVFDADVIITAAVLGYCLDRIDKKKPCAFAAEIDASPSVQPSIDLPGQIESYDSYKAESDRIRRSYIQENTASAAVYADAADGWILLDNAITRINAVLKLPAQSEGDQVIQDATPNYGEAGVIWIVGGSGNLSLTNNNRYVNSPLMSYQCGILVNFVNSADFNGYRGYGAYTGLSARESGVPLLFSTFRSHPRKDEVRWAPLKPEDLRIVISNDVNEDYKGNKPEEVWGQIGSNYQAAKTGWEGYYPNATPAIKKYLQMIYLDKLDPQKKDTVKYSQEVVGYTHGMIQAIYDTVKVRAERKVEGMLSAEAPYELGLQGKDGGPFTTKMASCFLCSLFMEANGFPASSVHLGKAESWAPAYYGDDLSQANAEINQKAYNNSLNSELLKFKDETLKACNDQWARYCLAILRSGQKEMQAWIAQDTPKEGEGSHARSFQVFTEWLNSLKENSDSNAYLAANKILDAATVQEKVVVSVVRTLRAPGK